MLLLADGIAVAAVCAACANLNWLLKWLITFHVLVWLDDDDDGDDDINGKRNRKLVVEAVAVALCIWFECCAATLALSKLIGLISCLYWINLRRMHKKKTAPEITTETKWMSEKERKERKKGKIERQRENLTNEKKNNNEIEQNRKLQVALPFACRSIGRKTKTRKKNSCNN